MALRRLRADLHIHTCLSPCGELTMSPRAVVERARASGLDIIAVTDHNTTENASAVIEARGRPDRTLDRDDDRREVHPRLFGRGRTSGHSRRRSTATPRVPAKMKFVGDQVIVDAADYVTGFSPRCLFGATLFSVHEAVALIHRHGGLAIACHIDRDSFSIISQLGFIPPGLGLEAVEVSSRLSPDEARRQFGPPDRLPIVRFSDAHKPEEIETA
jgi:hypothetical protein